MPITVDDSHMSCAYCLVCVIDHHIDIETMLKMYILSMVKSLTLTYEQ